MSDQINVQSPIDKKRANDALDETRDFWILSDPSVSPHTLRLHPAREKVVDSNGVNPHQGVDLPEIGTFKLPRMVIPLRGPSDLEDWDMAVRELLVRYSLHNLVDWNMLRPKWNDATSLKWQTQSRLVRDWLHENIVPYMLKHILKRYPRVEFADEFMEDLQKAVIDFGIKWDNEALMEVLRFKRSDCLSAKMFINSLDMMYRSLWVTVPAHIIIAILLKEVQDDMPSRTTMVLKDIGTRKSPWDTLTKKDFENIRDFLVHGLI
ncbi:hypothetical protein N7523_000343 [Penicillium sp. IBT 18751x]|nr:hypothetical protein N7523_000343 [Penicillium sp. IBT 18751x]